jgi:uncharacterized membrane protein YvlD (DUF360 family)
MKKILKDYFATAAALLVVLYLVEGVKISGNWSTFLVVSFGLYLLLFLVKPIAKIVFLPINLITLNLFGLVLNTVLLFALTKILPQFTVSGFYFSGFSYQGFVIPQTQIIQIYVLLLSATLITLVSTLLRWFLN